jgi:hypothetical protein
MAFDNDLDDDSHEERTHSYQQPHDVSFESLAATAESLNIAGVSSQFSAAARILLHQINFPLRAIWLQMSSQNLQRLMIPELLGMNGLSTTRIGMYDTPYKSYI